jgi:hypothetical protein
MKRQVMTHSAWASAHNKSMEVIGNNLLLQGPDRCIGIDVRHFSLPAATWSLGAEHQENQVVTSVKYLAAISDPET